MLTLARHARVFSLTSRSRWRSNRLAILCYHGFSRDDEHQWDPALYLTGSHFEARLRLLREQNYEIIPFRDGIARLADGSLPPRAVAITVDDGAYDFYAVAYPILQRLGVPVTLYVATYHVLDQRPVFDVAFRYLIWRARSAGVIEIEDPEGGDSRTIANQADFERVTDHIYRAVHRADWSAAQKHEWLARVATGLGLDWPAFLASRTLGLMHPGEIGGLDRALVDVQLHTHRHRVPEDRTLFLREIFDNRNALSGCGVDPVGLTHFCYPSGVHRRAFLPWLAEAGVTSAVTGVPGLASLRSHPLLLPRFVDTSHTSEVEFEGWVSGFRHWVKRPRRSFEATA